MAVKTVTVEDIAGALASAALNTMCVFVHRIDARGLDCVYLSLFDRDIDGLNADALKAPTNFPKCSVLLRDWKGRPWNNERMDNFAHTMRDALSRHTHRFIPSCGIQELQDHFDREATDAMSSCGNEVMQFVCEHEDEPNQDIAPAA